MAASEAILGYGTLFQTESLDSPNTWFTVAEVVGFEPPKPTREVIDRGHEHKPYEWSTALPGMKRGGEMAFTFNFIPGEADFDDLLAEMEDQEIRNRRMVFPNGAILPFAAFLIGLEPVVEAGAAIQCMARFHISGQVGPME